MSRPFGAVPLPTNGTTSALALFPRTATIPPTTSKHDIITAGFPAKGCPVVPAWLDPGETITTKPAITTKPGMSRTVHNGPVSRRWRYSCTIA